MDNNQPRKRQRTSKACDACHRRKAKCYWRYPSCVDCIRLGLDCTFDRSKDEAKRQDDNDHMQIPQLPEPKPDPTSPGLEQVMNNNIEEMVVFKYFAIKNHVFPIFNFASFHHRLRLYHEGAVVDDQAPFLASLHGVLAACGPHLQLAEAEFNEATAKKHLQTALSRTNQIILQQPTFLGTQALTCIVTCLRHPAFSDASLVNLLAVAIRMAFSLHLHRLDEVEGMNPEERLEKIRLFWCLYILDKEIALELNVPPLIDDNNIRVLEPRKISDDEIGLVRSLDDSHVLNIFAARHRLARIASQIWKELYTFNAQHRPKRAQLEVTTKLNDSLAQWKAEWFQYGLASDVASKWPEKTIELLANLQCQYFNCLLRRNFDRPYKAIEMKDCLRAGRQLDHQQLNDCCVLAARDTLRLTRAVRKGDLSYIFAALSYTVPAIVMVLSDMCMTSPPELQRKSDLEIVKDWLDIQGYLVQRMDQRELREEYSACREMFEIAEATNENPAPAP